MIEATTGMEFFTYFMVGLAVFVIVVDPCAAWVVRKTQKKVRKMFHGKKTA